jgi:hypothetical protein
MTAFMVTWNSWGKISDGTATTATGDSQGSLLRRTRSRIQSLSCQISTSVSLASHWGKFLVSFGQSRTTWDRGHREYTLSPVSAVKYAFDRHAVRSTPSCRSSTDKSVWNIRTSQPWRSTVSSWGIASSYRTPNPDRWTASSGRRLSSISIIWTGRMPFV